jgi:hypothetical protein
MDESKVAEINPIPKRSRAFYEKISLSKFPTPFEKKTKLYSHNRSSSPDKTLLQFLSIVKFNQQSKE